MTPSHAALIPCLRYRDADAVDARLRAAGAAMLIELNDEAHGGRAFTCRDLEGHVWSVGTYAP